MNEAEVKETVAAYYKARPGLHALALRRVLVCDSDMAHHSRCPADVGYHAGRLFALREAAYNARTPYRAKDGDTWQPSLEDATEARPVSVARLPGDWLEWCRDEYRLAVHTHVLFDFTRIGPGAVTLGPLLLSRA